MFQGSPRVLVKSHNPELLGSTEIWAAWTVSMLFLTGAPSAEALHQYSFRCTQMLKEQLLLPSLPLCQEGSEMHKKYSPEPPSCCSNEE